ncbi:MAG: tetratricopeptide repeat protein [Clostridia bacterium]|nr:tetratricopeptide repeat protein [Clostridia bacterium]
MEMNEIRLEAQDLNQQGAILLKSGNLEAAKTKFDKAIEIDPMLMDSYKNYGDLYMALQEYQNAKNSYKKAMLIEKNGLLHFLYGNACFMNDELHEGFESYNLAINEGYDSDEMMFFMGMAYEHMNDDNMALRYFQKACIKNPSRPDYLIKKIKTLIRLGMLDNANESTEELLAKAPEMFDGYHIKTMLLLHKKDYESAIVFAKAASEKFPEDADLLYDYAKSLSLAKKLDDAIKVIEHAKALKYFVDAERSFTLLEGQIFAECNNFEKAVTCCEKCIELEDEVTFDGEARFMLMNLYLAEPNYEKALEQSMEIVKRNVEDLYYYAALYYKPFCTKQLGDTDAARALFKEANSIYRLATLKNPAAIDVYLYRALCMKELEEYDKALDLLDFIDGLSTEIAEVHVIRSDIYSIQGRKSLADEELQKAYRIKPELKVNSESAGV